MTEKNSADQAQAAASDQVPYPFAYDHGRMPVFLKIVWVAALAFMTWYIVRFLLTSVGAELAGGRTGPITGLHNMEERLNRIRGLHVVHVRAGYFMENLLGNIDLIRSKGITGSAIRGDLKIAMIATKDIAEYAAERLTNRDFSGSSVRYLLGQRDLTLAGVSGIIGSKIAKPGLPYIMFPYDEAEKAMVAMGLSPDMSRTYVEMARAFNEETIKAEKRTKENTTPTSIESFCDEVFVPALMQKKAA